MADYPRLLRLPSPHERAYALGSTVRTPRVALESGLSKAEESPTGPSKVVEQGG